MDALCKYDRQFDFHPQRGIKQDCAKGSTFIIDVCDGLIWVTTETEWTEQAKGKGVFC